MGGRVFMRYGSNGTGGETARLLVTAPEGSTVVASKGGKTVNCEWKQVEIPNPDYGVLPNGYTQLESITNNASSVIDTGIVCKSTLKIQAVFVPKTMDGGIILGNSGNGEVNAFRMFGYANQWYLDFGSGGGYNRINGGTIRTDLEYSIEFGNRYIKNLDTDSDIIRSTEVSSFTKTYNVWAGSSGNDITEYKRIIIYDEDTFVAKMYPCKRDSDGSLGLYDIVRNQFYGATGTFIAGDVVPKSFSAYYYVGELNEYGRWDVTATKDGKTASDYVEATEATDINIELSFQVYNTTYLYYLGDECEDITGGWNSFNNFPAGYYESATRYAREMLKGETYLDGQQEEATSKYYITTKSADNKIDTTGYKSFVVVSEKTKQGTQTQWASFRLYMSTGLTEYLNLSGQLLWSGILYWSTNDVPINTKNINVISPDRDYNGYVTLWQTKDGSAGWINLKAYSVAMAKQDDISGLSSYGADIASIIANASTLLADETAVKYMICNCTGDFMWTALSTASFVTALNSSPYYSQIALNEEWGKALVLIS